MEHFARESVWFLIADTVRYRERRDSWLNSSIVITLSRIIFTRREHFAIFRRRVDY